jgi:hypothetical protein
VLYEALVFLELLSIDFNALAAKRPEAYHDNFKKYKKGSRTSTNGRMQEYTYRLKVSRDGDLKNNASK